MKSVVSPIQNEILARLKNAKQLRYAELHPDAVANDLFNYHLQSLVRKGLIARLNDGYELAEAGMQYVADPTVDFEKARLSLFKMNVITIASRTQDGEIEVLNQIRKSNPSFGKIGAMGGIVRKGETIEAAAKRKLMEETGLCGEFQLVGIERRHLYRDGQLFSDVLFPIAHCGDVRGELIATNEYGENFWVGINQAIRNDSAVYDSIQSIPIVLKALKSKKLSSFPFFYTETRQDN